MKTLTKKLLALAAFICVQSQLCAFKYVFRNKTGKDLNLTVTTLASTTEKKPPYFNSNHRINETADILNNKSFTFVGEYAWEVTYKSKRFSKKEETISVPYTLETLDAKYDSTDQGVEIRTLHNIKKIPTQAIFHLIFLDDKIYAIQQK